MKSAWRELVPSKAIASVGICYLTAMCGCQSWSPTSWTVPAGSRVPPPATGSYQHQGAYYNNPTTGTSLAPNKSTARTLPAPSSTVIPASATNIPASATNSLSPIGNLPATNLTASATTLGFQSASGQVKTAGYNDNGTGMAEVVSAGGFQQPTSFDNVTPTSGADANTNSGIDGNLQWR